MPRVVVRLRCAMSRCAIEWVKCLIIMVLPLLASALVWLPLLGAAAGSAEAAPAAPGADLNFLLEKAVESYCGFMAEQNPKMMSTFERGLYEGMALGFVMGQYPEQGGVLAEMEEKAFESGFYGRIRTVCPAKSFV